MYIHILRKKKNDVNAFEHYRVVPHGSKIRSHKLKNVEKRWRALFSSKTSGSFDLVRE